MKNAAPKHWKKLKVKYLVSMRSGDAIDSEAIAPEGEYPVYGGNGLRGYTDGFTHEGAVNPEGKFALLFSGLLETLFIERMEQNEDIFARFMNERDFQGLVSDWISHQVYGRLRLVNEKSLPKADDATSLLGL